ncbi:MAG: Cyclic di-GMP phosphodiesterase response regulator RpfG [Syntrophorhabdus sp. PtaU1.Bin153]|nr:MAG: Cyclic di-GMP phosphodiesterase response regulator RpfG [Syntrophorhabdus sp. PtaU1.Bin153]
MTGQTKAGILLLDDRPEDRVPIEDILTTEEAFRVDRPGNRGDILDFARETKPDMIICDDSIPVYEMLDLCRHIRSDPVLEGTAVVLVRPFWDAEASGQAFEAGADDWIEALIPPVVLINKVRTWLRIKKSHEKVRDECRSLRALNDVLDRNFKELTIILIKTLDSRIPGVSERAEQAKAMAEHITAKLEIDGYEKKYILLAAFLHEIGKIGLPEAIVRKGYGDLAMSEQTLFHQHPLIGSMAVSTISGFKDSASFICHQLENYDGSGSPDGLLGREIPTGARILRTIVFQEELGKSGRSTGEIIDQLKQSSNRVLDPAITQHLIDYLGMGNEDLLSNTHRINVDELKDGMLLAEDVYSSSGIKLLPKGAKLQEWMIRVLNERNHVDPIIGGVRICKDW